MTAEVIDMSSHVTTSKAQMADLLRRTGGGAVRVLSRGTAWARGILTRFNSLAPVAFVTRWLGKALAFAKGYLRHPATPWLVANMATTAEGRGILGKVIRPPLRLLGFLAKTAYQLVRTPLAWFGLEKVIDRPLEVATGQVVRALAWLKVNVAPYLTPESTVVRIANIVTSVVMAAILLKMPFVRWIPAERFLKAALVVMIVISVLQQVTEIAMQWLPQSLQDRLTDIKEGVLVRIDKVAKTSFAEQTIKATLATVTPVRPDEAPKGVPTPKQVAKKVTPADPAAVAEHERLVAEQSRILEQVGEVNYAIMVRDRKVPYCDAVMGRNESKRILREAGLPETTPKVDEKV